MSDFCHACLAKHLVHGFFGGGRDGLGRIAYYKSAEAVFNAIESRLTNAVVLRKPDTVQLCHTFSTQVVEEDCAAKARVCIIVGLVGLAHNDIAFARLT